MNPNMIASQEMPNLDFVESIAHTLADYGVSEEETYGLSPTLLRFIQYLIDDAAELESALIELHHQIIRGGETRSLTAPDADALRTLADALTRRKEHSSCSAS